MFKKFLITTLALTATHSFSNEFYSKDGRFVLIASPNAGMYERDTTDQYQRQIRDRHIQRFNYKYMNANTVQMHATNCNPIRNRAEVTLIVPTTISLWPNRNMYTCKITNSEFARLKSDIVQDSDRLQLTVYSIFHGTNGKYASYKLYGKDSYGRNVGYLYNLGQENTGIVFFYPDSIAKDLKELHSRWYITYDWKTFIRTFARLMLRYNPHIDIYSGVKNGENIYIIKYKD